MARRSWQLRVLAICPALVALLWIAGILRFRDVEIQPIEWVVLVAAGFTLQLLTKRAGMRRPLPQLPQNTNPVALTLFVSAILGAAVALFGALFEWFLEQYEPSKVPLALRALWHGACAFGAAYCSYLPRLSAAAEPRQPPDRTP